MPLYSSSDLVCEVMTELFQRVMADPAAVQELRRSNMSFRINISDPAAVVTCNGKIVPPEFVCGSVDGRRPDLVINTPMDVLHRVWTSEMKLGDAFFGGMFRVQGSKLRAMGLGGLFRRIEAIYPTVARKHGVPAKG